MPKSGANISLTSYDDIFSTEESRQSEQIQQISISDLHPFKNHPFKVLDDEAMQRTVESVAQFGVLAPLVVRPREEGGYEIISGHRRQHAAELAGLKTLPVIVLLEGPKMWDKLSQIILVSVAQKSLQKERVKAISRFNALSVSPT